MIPLCGHPARPPLEILISYSTRTVARCGLFQAVVPQSFAAVWCGRNIVPPMRLRRGQTRGYISAGKLFRQELVSKSLSARVCQQGRLAQLVERLLYTQKVGGSRPSPPTNLRSLRKLRVAQLSGKGIESRRNRRIGLGFFLIALFPRASSQNKTPAAVAICCDGGRAVSDARSPISNLCREVIRSPL